MDIKNIETFLSVARLQSFTHAAEELSYAQSTVTAQIQQLERELGFPLFDRVGRRIALTQLGEQFLANADDILHIWFQANTLGRAENKISGVLYVGVLESLLIGPMTDILTRFRSHYENVEVRVKMGQASEVLQLLRQNQLDLVYISGSLNAEPNLLRRYARREPLVFFSPPTHPLVGRKQIPLADFLSYDIVATERSGFCYPRLSSLAARQGLTLHHTITVDSTFAAAELVSHGMGLGFLPEYSIAKRLDAGQLVTLDIDIPQQIYYSQILYHKDKWIAPFVDGFVDIVREIRPET